MKKFLAFYLLSGIILFGLASCCGHQGQIKKMQATIDSLQSICSQIDPQEQSYKAELDGIYERLELIRINQEIIEGNFVTDEDDLTEDKRKIIQESINTIQRLMNENRKVIDSLSVRIKDSPVQDTASNDMLVQWLDNLNTKIFDKDLEVSELNEQLAKFHIKAQIQSKMKDSLKTVSNLQDVELNMVYFCKGSFKELTANKVLDKGVVAAKDGSKLSADVNMNYFTKVDRRKIGKIPVDSKRMTLKTSHPNGTYELEKDGNKILNIVIKDRVKFWSLSKYCVIMLE